MIIVCGGAGYIGSHLVRALLEQDEDVAVVDNLQTGHRQSLPSEARFYQGDLRARDFLEMVFRETVPEAVVHLAANSLVSESTLNPLKYFNNNLHGTEILLSAMVECGVKLIVFSSSAAVYGELDKTTISGSDPAAPTNPYGETKLAMEKMIKWTALAHSLKFVSLRYFNVAGASPDGRIGEDHHPETHLIPLALLTALKKRAGLDIYGADYDTPDGTCLRDYVQVSDLAEAHILALKHLRLGGGPAISSTWEETGPGFVGARDHQGSRRRDGSAHPGPGGPPGGRQCQSPPPVGPVAPLHPARRHHRNRLEMAQTASRRL